MFTRRSSFSPRSACMSRVSCQFPVASSQLTITTEHGHRVSTTGNGALTTDNLLEMGEKSEGKISAPGDLLRHCADLRLCWIEENSVHRATYCAIAWIIIARAGWRKSQCTGRPTAPIITRYRCFLPDLAGLAGLRRVGPGTGTILPSIDPPSLGPHNPVESQLNFFGVDKHRIRPGKTVSFTHGPARSL